MNIFVSGLLNVETTVSVRGFPISYYPIDYPFFGVDSQVSGVGCNIARALTALGDRVELVSFVGQDAEARRILDRLRADGLSTAGIRAELRRTPASVILYDPQGRRQIYCDLKDIQDRALRPEDHLDALRRCQAAALCNINFNRPLLRTARELGVLTATDVHVLSTVEDDYNRDFMEQSDLLFLSDEALPCPPAEFLMRLRDRWHNRVIVLGRGAEGAMLLDDAMSRPETVPAYSHARPVNTVGAGDALFSAFLHFYAAGTPAWTALERAVVFAGIKIGFNGGAEGFCSERELLARMEE